MGLKNLFRRKIRTLLTITGIGIGVAAIIALGALADGLEIGYSSMLAGSKADLILSQPNTFDISYSSIDEKVGEEISHSSEVSEISGMLQGFSQAEGEPFFFIFGHPKDSFILDRFQIIEGVGLDSREAEKARPKPVLLGTAAAEVHHKEVGDTLRLTGSVFRIVGIFETGDAFEDSGAILELSDAQTLLGKPKQVSLYYIQLKDISLGERFIKRAERLWPELALTGVEEFADKQTLADMLRGYVWAIGGLAIIIGGVGMMNAQLMSVMERTREIGVLRAIGWSKRRVLFMILSESLLVSILGGVIGVGLGWLLLYLLGSNTVFMGASSTNIRSSLLIQTFIIVVTLGFVGGLYPAWKASRMQPVEALGYEGGSSGRRARRLPIGGMALQSVWQRTGRTILTLIMIGITVGSIMALEGILRGFILSYNDMFLGTQVEIMIRQADIADTSLSAVDDRDAGKIEAMPEVKSVSGMIMSAVMMPEAGGFFILQGYAPNEIGIKRLKIAEGKSLTSNHQILLGRFMADKLNLGVGDTINLSENRFKIVGIYESGIAWEEMGGVVTMRDGQTFTGRPHKSTMVSVKLHDPNQAVTVVEKINQQFPELHASLAGEFLEQMPDMEASDAMMSGISFLAILIGGIGVFNTMLMAVFERTREIGVLRALGWRRLAILVLILKEALILGVIGGLVGIGIAIGLVSLLGMEPTYGPMITPLWEWDVFLRAIVMAVALSMIGGLYPAYRATRLEPVEALRYE